VERISIPCSTGHRVITAASLLVAVLLQPLRGGDREANAPDLVGDSPAGAATASSPDLEQLRAVIQDPVLARRALVLERPGDTLSFSMAELAVSPQCLEGRGGFTTSAGTAITGTWAGVSLPDLLSEWGGLRDESSVTFIADDGYRMTFEGKEILDRRQGTWILAIVRDGLPIPAGMGTVRAIKVGPSTPMVTGHVSVQGITRIMLAGVPSQMYSLAMRGRVDLEVDRQTLQSCVSCHGARVSVGSGDATAEYHGVPLFRLLAFSDDSLYAPHRQDSAILSYRRDLARAGYAVQVVDTEGATVSLDSRSLDGEERAMLALYRDGEPVDEGGPVLVVVADSDSAPSGGLTVVPSVKTVTLRVP